MMRSSRQVCRRRILVPETVPQMAAKYAFGPGIFFSRIFGDLQFAKSQLVESIYLEPLLHFFIG